MFYVTILRHGETINNVARVVQSITGGELTEKGILMAQSLGDLLKDEEFTHIFSSDLQRCRDTTKNIISKLRSKVPPVQYLEILRERNYGDWELKSSSLPWTKREEMGLPMHKGHKIDIPNGEPYADCQQRSGKFFQEYIIKLDKENQDDKNVLVVTHGNLIACFLEYLMENPTKFELINFEDEDLKRRFANTARTRFSIEKMESPSDSQSATRIRLTFSHVFDEQHLNTIS